MGDSCSGKTTFGRALADILGVPFVELDALNWRANWTMADLAEFQTLIRDATSADGWVVDGNYGGRGARDIVWPIADTVVWLDMPLVLSLRRMWRRTNDRIRRREALWGGNQETIRNTFFSRDSLFVWAVTTHRRRRRGLEAAMRSPENAHLDFVRLRSERQVAEWLAMERSRLPRRI